MKVMPSAPLPPSILNVKEVLKVVAESIKNGVVINAVPAVYPKAGASLRMLPEFTRAASPFSCKVEKSTVPLDAGDDANRATTKASAP
jgi:hypothetical protein